MNAASRENDMESTNLCSYQNGGDVVRYQCRYLRFTRWRKVGDRKPYWKHEESFMEICNLCLLAPVCHQLEEVWSESHMKLVPYEFY